MLNNNLSLHDDVLDFKKFKKDLYKKLGETGERVRDVSSTKLYRSPDYLANSLSNKSIPVNVFFALCNMYGLKAQDYEKKEKKEPEPAPLPKKETVFASTQPWETRTKIDTELGIVVFTILKNGEEKVTARALIKSPTDMGIIKDISYAAHMAYKLAQQNDLNDSFKEKKPIPVYKDWVKQYEKSNSTYGKLARYVKDHYSYFPKSGKKDMHVYMLQNRGTEYVAAFDLTFAEYLKYCDKNAASCGNS